MFSHLIANMLETTLVDNLAFKLLKDCETSSETTLPHSVFLQLYNYFGNTLSMAAEYLDKCKINKYEIDDGTRAIYKIGTTSEWLTIYEDINYCQCQAFKTLVLKDRLSLCCKHVLAFHLNKIVKVCTIDRKTVSAAQLTDLLTQECDE